MRSPLSVRHALTSLALACGLWTSGCLPVELSTADPTLEESLPTEYTARIYRMGELDGSLVEEMEAAFNFTAYAAGATDAPLVTSGDELEGLGEADRAGVAAVYAANQPVILFDATLSQINALRQILGLELGELALPEGVERVEVYALDHEPDQEVWQWIQYPPESSVENPDDAEDQQSRVGRLIDWLDDNQVRRTLAEQEAEGAVGATKDGIVNQLTELASAFVDQRSFCESGNTYQISHFIYSFHSVATGQDWFFIQQRGMFNGSGAYTGMQFNTLYNNHGNAASFYMDSIDVDSTIREYAGNPALVGLIKSSPETANNVEKLSSSMSYSVGGDVSFGSGGPSGKVSGGVSVSSSRSFAISDCTANNYSLDGGNNAHWQYVFKRCEAYMPFTIAYLRGPPNLSVSAFQPVNQWIWRFQPQVRESRPHLHVAFRVNLVGTTARTFLLVPFLTSAEHETRTGTLFEYDLALPLPPKE